MGTFRINGITYTANDKFNPCYKIENGEKTRIKKAEFLEAHALLEASATTTEKKGGRSNKDNRSNGTFALVRRNDNRVRVTSDGKTIATIQVGKRVCSIHTATDDVFEVLDDEIRKTVTDCEMGPNHFKLTVATDKVDETARTLFGTCEEDIITK